MVQALAKLNDIVVQAKKDIVLMLLNGHGNLKMIL